MLRKNRIDAPMRFLLLCRKQNTLWLLYKKRRSSYDSKWSPQLNHKICRFWALDKWQTTNYALLHRLWFPEPDHILHKFPFCFPKRYRLLQL